MKKLAELPPTGISTLAGSKILFVTELERLTVSGVAVLLLRDTVASDAWFPPFSEAEWRLAEVEEHPAVEALPAHAYQLWQRR